MTEAKLFLFRQSYQKQYPEIDDFLNACVKVFSEDKTKNLENFIVRILNSGELTSCTPVGLKKLSAHRMNIARDCLNAGDYNHYILNVVLSAKCRSLAHYMDEQEPNYNRL